MNQVRGSYLYKTLVHIILFIAGLALILSAYHVVSYLDEYSANTHSVYETPLFQSKYLKYVERVAVYIDYREKGFTSLTTFDPSATDITNIIEETKKNIPIQSILEGNQAEFDYYNAILNVDNASFQYYVKNLETDKVYASPSLDKVVKEHNQSENPTASLEEYLQSVQDNEAYLIINTKTRRFFTNVNRNYQYLSEENIDWVMNYITGTIADSTQEDGPENHYIICTNININASILNTKDEFTLMHNNYKRLYNNYTDFLYFIPISLFIILGFLILAVASSGYKKNIHGLVLLKFDNMMTEVYLALSIVIGLSLLYGITYIYDILRSEFYIPKSYTIGVAYALAYPLVLFLLLSAVRRLKAGLVINNSLSHEFIKYLCKFTKSFFAEKNLTYPLAGLFLLFAALQGIGIFFFFKEPMIAILMNVVAYGILVKALFQAAMDISTIRNATKKISEGETNIKIDIEHLSIAGRTLGEYVNNIGDGISVAVDEKLKSERLKTELIANVSHDIKTPLTSIINYVDLLKKENLDNPRANDYLNVLSSKSWRLKTLIEDLVEASKASSGTIALNLESLNLVELLRQSLGEFQDKFVDNDLEIIFNATEEPLYILADGRSTYRIIENILSNANKYALKGTRIYVDIYPQGEHIVVYVKNISATKLNIHTDELMERFVRGDLSRNTEGSGLGLSITKSLASLQNASFEIILDGDLFKAVLKFKRLMDY